MELTAFHIKVLQCQDRVHCKACRTSSSFRESVTGKSYFPCLFDGEGSLRFAGEEFHRLIVSAYRVRPCSKCEEVITEMNRLGVEGCRAKRSEILEGIWSRKDNLVGWRGMAARLPGAKHTALAELGKLFDKALEKAT